MQYLAHFTTLPVSKSFKDSVSDHITTQVLNFQLITTFIDTTFKFYSAIVATFLCNFKATSNFKNHDRTTTETKFKTLTIAKNVILKLNIVITSQALWIQKVFERANLSLSYSICTYTNA